MGITQQIGASSIIKPGVIDNTASRPASPYEGQVIFQKDTDQLLVWNGTAWVMFANANQPPGLQLIKTQTIGSAVASVPVTDAFSADYDNYKIIVNGGVGSTIQNLSLQLGSTTTGYYGSQIAATSSGVVAGSGMNGISNWSLAGISSTNSNYLNAELLNPFLTKPTTLFSVRNDDRTAGSYGTTVGFLDNSTSYTGFTLIVAGTMTGGTIRVYGYRNS